VPDRAAKSLRISEINVRFFVTQDLPGSDLELYRPQIRQLPVWGRCDKRNWGNVSVYLSGVPDSSSFTQVVVAISAGTDDTCVRDGRRLEGR
jgi:hypothetical protein